MATYFREYTDGEGEVYREYSTSDGTWNAVTKVSRTKVAESMPDITKELATDICKKTLGYYSDGEIVTLCLGKGHWVPEIVRVIFHDPATIVFWADGTKTVVKVRNPWSVDVYGHEVYDPEKGLAMAIAKKALGNTGSYYNVFKKWLKEGGYYV